MTSCTYLTASASHSRCAAYNSPAYWTIQLARLHRIECWSHAKPGHVHRMCGCKLLMASGCMLGSCGPQNGQARKEVPPHSCGDGRLYCSFRKMQACVHCYHQAHALREMTLRTGGRAVDAQVTESAVNAAGNMSWRLPFLTMLARSLNCAVFAPR